MCICIRTDMYKLFQYLCLGHSDIVTVIILPVNNFNYYLSGDFKNHSLFICNVSKM